MSRNAAQRGEVIALTATFLDAGGDYTDPSGLTMSVYPTGVDPRNEGVTTDDAWVYGVTLTNVGQGPQASLETITKLSIGKYEYRFVIPADADLGAAFDRWQGTVDLVDLDETFSFTIVGGGSIGTTQLYINNVVFVRLASTIADTDGNLLLNADGDNAYYEFYFTTTYTPLYSSVRRIRLDLGRLIANIPDDTINLALFEASLQADALSFGTTSGLTSTAQRFFTFSRREFVTCAAELILLNAISGSGTGAGDGGKSKRLADLQVAYGDSKNVDTLLGRAIACQAKYQSILTSAGELGPGTSKKPSMVVKGELDLDRPNIGRDWEPTSTWDSLESQLPAANTHSRRVYRRRWKRDFNRWSSRFYGDEF